MKLQTSIPSAPTGEVARKVVAIYCRKSTEEGLDREFNSLDAQRQSCEQFAASQRGEGWVVSPERYDDGGFSGGNTDRPGLQRLMADVEAGKVQVIAVYKLDRMSRSLTDFVGLLQKLDAKQVAFVSVTQHFNTATPMGRLMFNVLICFAQFERENTIERIRDKVAATKRMGRWCGGVPILGYDVVTRKLAVNEAEAEQVRTIFSLYLKKRGLVGVIRELDERGWTNKAWTSESGHKRGGNPFSKSSLSRLLTNIHYTGRIRYRGDIIQGEHSAIIETSTFEAAQSLLQRQQRGGGSDRKTKHHALLKGLLVCGPCNCGMTYCWSRRGSKVYAYYTCDHSRSHGADTCPMPNLPAVELERMVVDEVAAICRDPRLVAAVTAEAVKQHAAEVDGLRDRIREAEAVAAKLAQGPDSDPDRTLQAEAQVEAAHAVLADAEAATISKAAARSALAQFEPVWSALVPTERSQLLRLMVERIRVDGQAGKLAFVFRAGGIATLAKQAGAA